MKRTAILLMVLLVYKIGQSQSLSPLSSEAHFCFHSGIWINLHHFLYYEALLKVRATGRNGRNLAIEDTVLLNKLDLPARAFWEEAIDYYAKNLIHRDLLFDTLMVTIKDYLEDQETKDLLDGAKLAPDLQISLNNVVESYRIHFWPAQNAANQKWLLGVKSLLQQNGPAVSAQLAKFYLTPWPADSIRVDVTNYASWSGAYTTTDPNRITISSTDTSNQGSAGLEVLFHEASHIIIDSIARKIDQVAASEKKVLPNPLLWHALLFYSTGEIVRRALGQYEPYAYKNGLWKRAWPMYIGPLEKDWKPYLDGRTSIDVALRQLIRDI